MNHIHTIRVGEQDYAIGTAIDDTSRAADKTWSAQMLTQVIARLCPPIRQQGRCVQCCPQEQLPWTVTTLVPEGSGALILTRCGKNLFDHTAYGFIDSYIRWDSGVQQSSSGYSCTGAYVPVDHLRGKTLTLNHPPAEKNTTSNGGLAFFDAEKVYISGSNGYTHQVPENAAFMRFSVPREYADGTQVQLELGDKVTDYQPYDGQVLEAQPQGQQHQWTQLLPRAGVNTLWSSRGETLVEGSADPIPLLSQLMQ